MLMGRNGIQTERGAVILNGRKKLKNGLHLTGDYQCATVSRWGHSSPSPCWPTKISESHQPLTLKQASFDSLLVAVKTRQQSKHCSLDIQSLREY